MSKYLVLMIVFAVIYVVLTAVRYYLKNVKGKSYETFNHIETIASILVWLNVGHWMLNRFFDGNDSSIWLHFLAYFVGVVVAGCLNGVTLAVCERIWPKRQDVEILNAPKALRQAVYFVTALLSLAFLVFFCVGFVSHFSEATVGDIILLVIGILIFAAGAFTFCAKFIKGLKK